MYVKELSRYVEEQERIRVQFTQVENLSRILDRLKRHYNVDENRVYLTGISDGGTGVFFVACRDTTPWASFLPLIGSMTVLANPLAGVDGEIYPGNAANKPFFVVNAGRDRLQLFRKGLDLSHHAVRHSIGVVKPAIANLNEFRPI